MVGEPASPRLRRAHPPRPATATTKNITYACTCTRAHRALSPSTRSANIVLDRARGPPAYANARAGTVIANRIRNRACLPDFHGPLGPFLSRRRGSPIGRVKQHGLIGQQSRSSAPRERIVEGFPVNYSETRHDLADCPGPRFPSCPTTPSRNHWERRKKLALLWSRDYFTFFNGG